MFVAQLRQLHMPFMSRCQDWMSRNFVCYTGSKPRTAQCYGDMAPIAQAARRLTATLALCETACNSTRP